MSVNQYALLIAVALPVAVIVGIQIYLFICGERGTLLLPGLDSYPSIERIARQSEIAGIEPMAVVVATRIGVAEPANEEFEHAA